MTNIASAPLSLSQKVGQLIMFGFDAETINDHAHDMIVQNHLGNVVLFTRNVTTPESVFKLNQSLQALALKHNQVPLFIAIDQEGGMVTRIQHTATYFPGAMTLAATGDVENAYRVGFHMGNELSALGINMNLAPVLDVNNNPKNPVIGVRSYSDDPSVVSAFGNRFIDGLQEHIIATAKHFPGHGDTHVDSHLALPKVSVDGTRLETMEIYPFKRAIEHGIQAVMSSHVHYPALDDSGVPATLSQPILTGLLREKLGFKGIVITDCMQMKAIQNQYQTPEAALMAIQAGADIVCVCHSYELQRATHERIMCAVLNGELPMAMLEDRVNRILRYKADMKKITIEENYRSVQPIVENHATQILVQKMVDDALTLVKGDPLKLKKNALLVGLSPQSTSIADEKIHEDDLSLIQKAVPSLEVYRMNHRPDAQAIASLKDKAKRYDQIIILTYNANIYNEQIALIEALASLKIDQHIIAMRNPYDLFFTDTIDNFSCLYEYTPNAIRTLIKYLKNEQLPQGRLPIHYE